MYSSFTFTEKSYEFEKGIKHILKTHGHIGKLYTDNGSTFVSEETKRILSILGIPLIHSRPRKPAGRGKIERFFRTVRDQFLRPLDKEHISGIDELNIKFKTWLEGEYHRNPHRSLNGLTPLECFMNKARYIIRVKEEIDLENVFLHEISRKVYKDNTFSLCGVLYETPGILCGKKIKLRYDPAVMNPIHIYLEGSYICDAKIVDTYANCRIIRDTHSKTIAESSRQVGDSETENTKNDLRIISSLSASKISGGIR
jgi:putative transposase